MNPIGDNAIAEVSILRVQEVFPVAIAVHPALVKLFSRGEI
jgi:hypothetical protein